ncbi:uncharacterized protein GO595_006917 [Histomonas meleagridis]|uniref:uncharacterized protein n=1 Tax=Histomonas meleagridis TaxID=135588 RepID=UPI0035599D2B|nr:hypothetical protein GO595_006917 [Histomonas meleagridis]
MSELFSILFRENIEIPPAVHLICHFVYLISPDLYARIFDYTIRTEINIYSETLSFENQAFEETLDFLQQYLIIQEKLNNCFEASTVNLFHNLYFKDIVTPVIDKLVNKETIEYSSQNPIVFQKLWNIVKSGDEAWETDLIKFYKAAIKENLDKIPTNPYFDFCVQVSDYYEQTLQIVHEVFGEAAETARRAVSSTFGQFLEEKTFVHEVCILIDRTLKPLPFVNSLREFFLENPDFEEVYKSYMAHRLLTNPNVEVEQELIDSFQESGIILEKAKLLLKDFEESPTTKIEINGVEVSLILLNQFCWSVLHAPTYNPPKLFQDIFEEAYKSLNFDLYRKVIRMNDRWSNVEFSDGTTTFSLPFFHACFVQTILERGPLTEMALLSSLHLTENEAKQALEFLYSSKILSKTDGVVSFAGPPIQNSEFAENSEDQIVVVQEPEDLALYTDCSDQIRASIIRFLKQRRFALASEIKEEVFRFVPKQFPVTEEKIESCLKKLVEMELIMHHGGKSDTYRYKRY